jgi:D-arabinose 1-dehydrogenase-like Zn-dependent alcohol dehydrogenase
MRAERFYTDSKTIAVEDIRYPSPAQARSSKIAFCGICHSDLSLINGTFPPQRPVVTQGHEASGAIARLGAGVTGWAEGDRVIVAAGRPCMTCPNCRRDDMTNCHRVQLMAFAHDGAWAEHTVAQAVGLTRVPDNVPLEQAAILADAASMPFGAVVRTGRVGIGESVGVWGVGGVGTHIARLVGAVPVIAIDQARRIGPGARVRRRPRGGRTHPGLRDKIAEITGGQMLDVAFDAVGLKSTFEQGLDCVTVGGRLVSVGMSAESPSVGPTSMFGLTLMHVLGHLGYQNVDIETLATLLSRARLDLSRSISDIVSLEDVSVGIEKLERQEDNPIRILVKP